ncbi:hypothetical protein QWY85_10955 [Neolewinella lacunae]|uniref:6-bladed beta-propeller n=1 Tax=Neolewinella lacunae TaxID=1517758 RepID=A0A923PKT3_9BACT|nr:hypothetical protein [Neolewinella lacunae]MBC6995978.1 hypothetical protein [Neolewinella lacunae]MDN3635178.1 hypothetical protein [Neolewinella lacunae]
MNNPISLLSLANFTIFLSLSAVFLGCRHTFTPQLTDDSVEVIALGEFEKLNFKETFVINRYVPLLSVEGMEYLHKIDKVRIYEDDIYVLQEQLDRTLFKFSSEGIMRKSIDGVNAIDKKFYAVNDFVVRNNEVVLTDRLQSQIIFYDRDLNYLRHLDLNLPNGLVNLNFLPSGKIVARPVIENGEPSSLYLNSPENPAVFMPMIGFKGIAQTPAALDRVMMYETFFPSASFNSMLYADLWHGNIWEVDETGVKEKYRVEIPKSLQFSQEELQAMEHMNAEEILYHTLNLKREKFILFDQIFENEEMLIISFTRPWRRNLIIKNKITGKIEYKAIHFDDLTPNNIDQSLPLKYLIGFTDTGELIFYHDAEEFKNRADAMKYEHPSNHQFTSEETQFLAAANQINENCSVVLTFVSIR